MNLFACWFPWRWSHKTQLARHGFETCTECGRRFKSRIFAENGSALAEPAPREHVYQLDPGDGIVKWPFEGEM